MTVAEKYVGITLRVSAYVTSFMVSLYYLSLYSTEWYYDKQDPPTIYLLLHSCCLFLIIFQYSTFRKYIDDTNRRYTISNDLSNLKDDCISSCFNSNIVKGPKTPSELGFIPSKQQTILENPYIQRRTIQNTCNRDEKGVRVSSKDAIAFRCGSDSGSWLVVKYERNILKNAGMVWILWHHRPDGSKSGNTYVNVVRKQKGNVQYSTDHSLNDSFKAGGLTLTVLEPFRRWRIAFNGMMRNIDTGKINHTRMNLIWSALSSPFEWNSCYRTQTMVESFLELEALTGKKCNAEFLNHFVKNVFPTGYEQWGAIFGKVAINDHNSSNELDVIECEDTNFEVDLYYRGLRYRDFIGSSELRSENGPKSDTNQLSTEDSKEIIIRSRRQVSVLGVTENGFHFIVHRVFFKVKIPPTLSGSEPVNPIGQSYHSALADQNKTDFSFGHIMIPGQDVVPITEFEWSDNDLVLNSIDRKKEFYFNEAFSLRFKAGKRWFNVGVHRLDDENLYNLKESSMEYPTSDFHTTHRIGFAATAPNSGRGHGMINFLESNLPAENHIDKNNSVYDSQEVVASLSKIRNQKEVEHTNPPLVASLADCEVEDESLSGGKGRSLYIMTHSNNEGMLDIEDSLKPVSIPNGIVVTSEAFKRQIKFIDTMKGDKFMSNLISDLEAKSSDYSVSHAHWCTTVEIKMDINEEYYKNAQMEKKMALEKACNNVQKAFLESEICTDIVHEINHNLNKVFPSPNETKSSLNESSNFQDGTCWNEKLFAVRSSAVGEDSDELSAAGQNETYLGIKGTEPCLQEAIRKCWASLFTIQSVEYRRQNGQTVAVGMAVVVQEMVPAKVAGVMFSVHPFTGNPAEVVITVNYGLGESIVSAISEPDTITLSNNFWEKEQHGVIKVKRREIGSKQTKVVLNSLNTSTNEGIRVEKVETINDEGRICIDDNMAIQLAKIASRLQIVFEDTPRDIEFAIDENDQIFLLQARPITSLQSWTNDELMHEFDTANVSEHDINTKANVGEVFPGATSTLTLSWCTRILDLAIQTNRSKEFRKSYNKFSEAVVRISHHHVLLNFLDLFFELVDSRKVTVPMKAVDFSVFGHLVTDTNAIEKAIQRKGGIDGFWEIMRIQLGAIKQLWFIRQLMKQPKFDEQFYAPMVIDKTSSAIDAYDAISNASLQVAKMWSLHSSISQASTTLQLITFIILSENPKDIEFSNEFLLDAVRVLKTNSEDVISGDCPEDLDGLCKAIIEANEAENGFHNLSIEKAENWIMSRPTIANMYTQFLKKFGHRCLREFDLVNKPWREERKPLIKTLQVLVKSLSLSPGETKENSKSPKTSNKSTIDSVLDQLNRKIKPFTRAILKFILPYTHGSTALREKAKSLGISQVHDIRLAYRNLALTMAKKGCLPDPELIFHMSHFEIQKLIRYRSPVIIQKAIRRRRLRSSEWEALRFPEMIYGVPAPLGNMDDTILNSDTSLMNDGEVCLTGTPASRGKYKGPCRVITRLEDAEFINKGEILITISTDIGWSPYFPLLGGVVTELGGLISHGAVVAREYGLPCIVGVQMATSKLASGDILVIDGFRGTITKSD